MAIFLSHGGGTEIYFVCKLLCIMISSNTQRKFQVEFKYFVTVMIVSTSVLTT